ncbi:MAG: PaaI family thioesterase [Planctomycetia bacterium]
MTTDDDPDPATIAKPDHHIHPECIVCGLENPIGWKLQFQTEGESVFLKLHLSELLQGYTGIIHGGVIATLLDAAMTHCLFANGIEAVTGDLNILYRHSVPVNATVLVRAWIDDPHPPLYKMKAEITLDTKLLVRAKARFVARDKESAGQNSP